MITFCTEYFFTSKRCLKCDALIVVSNDPAIATVKRCFEGSVSNPQQVFRCANCNTVLEYTLKEAVS